MKTVSPAYSVSSSAYDQRLGQFLSADPFVQDPTNSQNYNRYAYCLNNPLKYTDPSGYRASNGNNNYLNDNDPSKTFDPFETSNVRIWAKQIDYFRTYMTNYKYNEVLVGVIESVFSESDGAYYAFSSGFYIGKYDGKLVFTTKISDLQNLNIWYNNGQYYYSALMDIGDHSNDRPSDFPSTITNVSSNYDGFDLTNDIIGGIGMANDGLSMAWSATSNSTQHQIVNQLNYHFKNNGWKIQNRAIRNGLPKVFRMTGNALNVASIALTVVEVGVNSEFKASNALDLTVTGLCFIPVVGWAIGAGYLIGNAFSYGVSGKSIGDHLNESLGNNKTILKW